MAEVLEVAIGGCDHPEDLNLRRDLLELARMVSYLKPASAIQHMPSTDLRSDWVAVIGHGEKAIYTNDEGSHEVEIVQYRFTPHGPMYELKPREPSCRWMVTAATVQPINGLTRLVWLNLVTGETKEFSEQLCPIPLSPEPKFLGRVYMPYLLSSM